jgi:hypothetical protein
MARSFFLSFLAAATVSGAFAQQAPPQQIDLSKFPAAAVDEVVVPVPSEVFIVLDKTGAPNWKAEMRGSLGKNTGDRAQVALLLGTVIAEGFIAVEAEDSERVKSIGQEVLDLSSAIGVRQAVISRAKSIMDKADARNWQAVRTEFDGALQDVRGAMEELGDDELAQLVSLGGWVRGTQALTSIVKRNYTPAGAELLNQPELLNYFSRRLDGMGNRLRKDELVAKTRKTLKDIRPLIGKDDGKDIPLKNVEKINQLTSDLVNNISGEDQQ